MKETLDDMLQCREKRAERQQVMLDRWHNTLISFTLNIPGPVKTNEQLYRLYSDACSTLTFWTAVAGS